MKQLPNQLRVRITKKDIEQAKDYCSSGNCLMATILKRRGYKKVAVDGNPEGQTDRALVGVNDDLPTHAIAPAWWSLTLCCDVILANGYNKDLVGKTYTLTRVKFSSHNPKS